MERDILRHSHLVDPQLHIWGWEIPVYLFLGGVTAGLMVVAALLGQRLPAAQRSTTGRLFVLVAPVLLSLGMLALLLDLELKRHLYRFYLAFRWSSPMSWGAWLLLAIYPTTVLLGLAETTRDELTSWTDRRWLARLRAPLGTLRTWAARRLPQLRTLSIALGVALGAYTGVLLGTLGGRAAWSSLWLAPLFLISGVSTGAALTLLLPIRREEHRLLARWDAAAISVELLVLLLLFLDLLTASGQLGRDAVALFVGGAYTVPFFALVVVAGLAMPLTLSLLEQRRGLRPTALAPTLVLIGGLSLRYIIVLAGQS